MHTRTRAAASALATLAVAGGAAGTAAAQATPYAPGQLAFVSQLTAIEFFTASGPITGFPATPLVPGDRIIGQDRILQHGRAVRHDNEACTVSFGRDMLCHDVIILPGQGDLQASWTIQWPAPPTPAARPASTASSTAEQRTSPPPTAPSTRPRCATATCRSPPRPAQASNDARQLPVRGASSSSRLASTWHRSAQPPGTH